MSLRINKPLTVSIVIPVYNEEYYLKLCLDAIALQNRQPDEIIVVDNNSTDQTVAVARHVPLVRIVTEKTQGVLYASRKGFDVANSDIIARIDADTVMEPDWIEQIHTYFAHNPDVAAITGNCYFYDFPFRRIVQILHHSVYYGLQKLITGTEILWGSNMAITADAWQSVRKECISHPGIHEDIDLSFQLQAQGLSIVRVPQLLVGVSMLRGNLSPVKMIRYLWPWPTNSLKSYFWSWSRTYWLNKRPLQSVTIALVVSIGGIILFPLICLRQITKFITAKGPSFFR